MASPHQPHDTDPGNDADDPTTSEDDEARPVIRVRVVPWDIACTVTMLLVLLVLVTTTSWPTRLFGFAENVCPADLCAPVPYGVNYYIFPVMWGGIGAALAAAIVGPFVSLLRGWYMSFWPVLAVAIITLTSVAGYAMTGFSERYWH